MKPAFIERGLLSLSGRVLADLGGMARWVLLLSVLAVNGCHAMRGLHHGIQRDIDHLSSAVDKMSDRMDWE